MIPTWAAIVGALSLAMIALAAITSALAILVVALGIRSFVKAMQDTTLPVVADVRHLVASIRTEVDGIAESSRDIRQRLVRAADGAEARLADIAAAVRTVKDGVALWKLARAPRGRRPKRRKS